MRSGKCEVKSETSFLSVRKVISLCILINTEQESLSNLPTKEGYAMTPYCEIVPTGGFRVSADTRVELVTVTGSCVAVVLYDSEKRVGGMLHVVLPGRRKSLRSKDRNAFFADTGVPLLINEMIRYGANPEKVTATVAGGASLLSSGNGETIGLRNVNAVIDLLVKAGIPISVREVGGKVGRRVTLSVATGVTKTELIREEQPGLNLKSENRSLSSGRKSLSEYLKYLLSRLTALKPNPAYTKTLLNALHENPVNWKKIKEILPCCLILNMHVFRLANSPYYGIPGKISSLDQGLSLLGPRHLRRICVLASLFRQPETDESSSLGNIPGPIEISGTRISQHSLCSAIIARYLARTMPRPFQEDVFTGALFHAIGNLALAVSSHENIERNMNCGEIGGLILEAWGMPGHIVEGVASYESVCPDDKPSSIASFIHAGCGISRLLGMTTPLEPGEFSLLSDSLKRISLSDGIYGIIPELIKLPIIRNSLK